MNEFSRERIAHRRYFWDLYYVAQTTEINGGVVLLILLILCQTKRSFLRLQILNMCDSQHGFLLRTLDYRTRALFITYIPSAQNKSNSYHTGRRDSLRFCCMFSESSVIGFWPKTIVKSNLYGYYLYHKRFTSRFNEIYVYTHTHFTHTHTHTHSE